MPIGDADGRPLEDRPVLGSDASYQMACIASANQALQDELVAIVQRGIDRLQPAGHERRRSGRLARGYALGRLADGAVQCHVCPRLCRIRPGKSGVCRARVNQRRNALRHHLRPGLQRRRRPYREEAALPLLPRHHGALAGQRRLQLHLPALPELADRARRPRGSHARPARAARPQPAGPGRTTTMPRRRLDVQRADDLARVHPGRRPGRARTRPVHGDGHQRVHHRGGARRARAAHRRLPRRCEGLERRAVPGALPHPRISPCSRRPCAPSTNMAATSRSSPTSSRRSTTTTRPCAVSPRGSSAELGAETPWHVTRFMPYLEFTHLPSTPITTLQRAVEHRARGRARSSSTSATSPATRPEHGLPELPPAPRAPHRLGG